MTENQLQRTAQTSLTTPFSEPWLLSLWNATGEVNGRPTLMSGMMVSERQKREMRSHTTRLQSRLSCGATNRQEIAIELAKLFAAFPAQGQSDSPAELRMAAYFEALTGVPSWAVQEARGRVFRGETKLNTSFAPTPPQLAEVCRAILDPLRADLRRLQIITDADENREPSAEEKQRVVNGFAKLKADLSPPSTS